MDDLDFIVQLAQSSPHSSFFVLALIVSQALFLIFRIVVGEILGIYRLLVLAVLSIGVTIVINLLSGKTVVESVLLDSGTLMAYQVLLHQIKKQWDKRDADAKDHKKSDLPQTRH